MKMNNRGEASIILIAIVAVLGTLYVGQKGNLFDRSADPSNRRTASSISGRDIVEITNQVAEAEKPVTVRIDRSVDASAEITDPKLTWGQKIGRFFGGLGTWAIVAIGVFIALCIIFPMWRAWVWKQFARNQVAGIRDIDDPAVYEKVTKAIKKRQEASGKAKHDAVLVDKLKATLH